MKLNWKKSIASALMAAGIFVPSAVQAYNVPLGDPGFEDYDTAPHGGFSYASPTGAPHNYTGAYRPTSAWISNPGNAGGPLDGGRNDANWMYNAAYVVSTGGTQPAPRSGNQAMHGRFHYSGQVTSESFEAGKTYTFSIWAQGDRNAEAFGSGWQSRTWLYIFDGSDPFEEATSLTYARYSPIDVVNPGPADYVNRDLSWTDAQSQAAWQQISISWTVAPGAPEIGNPVGVAFWLGGDGALDDATLTVVPEPASVILVGAAGLTLLGLRRRI